MVFTVNRTATDCKTHGISAAVSSISRLFFYHKYSNALLSLALFILSQVVADHSIVYANVKSILIQQDEIRDCF